MRSSQISREEGRHRQLEQATRRELMLIANARKSGEPLEGDNRRWWEIALNAHPDGFQTSKDKAVSP